MPLKPFLRLLRDGRLTALLGVGGLLKPFYKLTYLAAAGEVGLLKRLAAGPATFDSLAEFFVARGQGNAGSQSLSALEAWLQMGVGLGLLKLGPDGYSLRGLAQALARPENDAALALVEEVVGLHHKLITGTVPKLRGGELWSLADQDGELIARSSRVLEAFQEEVIQRTFPARSVVRLLEIGCGSGVYLRYAAAWNPALSAVGVELQAAVAEVAKMNLRGWGLQDRVRVEEGDIRAKVASEQFDIATLYNNIYYFPVDERVALFEHIGGFLKPRGFLLVITLCQGGSLSVEALNLWAAATRGAGRLPAEQELVRQLRDAGYSTVKTMSLIPGDRLVAFQAFRG